MEYQNHSELRLRSDEAFWSRCIIAFLEVPPSLLNLLDSTSWAVAACMMRRQGRNPEDTGEHDYLKRTEKKTSLSRILKLSQAFDFFSFFFLLFFFYVRPSLSRSFESSLFSMAATKHLKMNSFFPDLTFSDFCDFVSLKTEVRGRRP